MLAVLLALGLLGCERQQAAAPPPMDVSVTAVVAKEVPVFSDWIGVIKGYINAQIRPQVTGYLLTQAYKEGDVVKPGQLMFQVDPREFQAELDQARGNLAKAEAAQGRTQLDVNRYMPLAKEGAVSQQELDNAIQNNAANIAAVEAARAAVEQAQLNLGWTKVQSPIQGVSGIAVAQIGDLVSPTTVLTTVSQVDPIKVAFPVAEQEYLRYRRMQAEGQYPQDPAKGNLELLLADGSVFPHRGSVAIVGREIDPRTGTIIIEGLFPNPDNVLRPGGYAKVRAMVDRLPNAMVVPQAAVQNFQGASQLAVVTADDTVEMRNVTTGPKYGTEWVVLDGVKVGDRVIVEGLQKVRAGMKVAPRPYAAPTVPPTQTPAPF